MSEEAIQETFEYLLTGARDALARGRSFVPFGAGIRRSGERMHFSLADDEASAARSAHDHIAALITTMQRTAGLTAIGVCFDGQVQMTGEDAADAICMHIEIDGGETLEAFVPYVREPQGLAVLDPIFAPTDPEVFQKG